MNNFDGGKPEHACGRQMGRFHYYDFPSLIYFLSGVVSRSLVPFVPFAPVLRSIFSFFSLFVFVSVSSMIWPLRVFRLPYNFQVRAYCDASMIIIQSMFITILLHVKEIKVEDSKDIQIGEYICDNVRASNDLSMRAFVTIFRARPPDSQTHFSPGIASSAFHRNSTRYTMIKNHKYMHKHTQRHSNNSSAAVKLLEYANLFNLSDIFVLS